MDGSTNTSAPLLRIRLHSVAERGVILAVAGDLDLATIDQLTTTAATLLSGRRPRLLALDLSAVGFLDARSVGALIGIHRSAHQQGCRVVIVALSPAAARILCLTGVGALFVADYPTGMLAVDDPPAVRGCASEWWSGRCHPTGGPQGCTRWSQP